MRISELSRTSGVSTATVKYYLREGLLPPGEPRGRNRAEYGPTHVHRLRLIRVLIDVGGLSIAQVRVVVQAVADERVPVHDMLGVAHKALARPSRDGAETDDVARADGDVAALVASLGWQVGADAPACRKLADALVALRRLGWDVGADVFRPYAELADQLAAFEVATLPTDAPRAELVERAVVGTVVFGSALDALRMLAQTHHSATRFAPRKRPRRTG